MRTFRLPIALLCLLGCIVAATAYSCDPAVCKPPSCQCALQTPPLPVDQMPQFILFTHDDATGPVSLGLINQTTAGFKNPNGCNLPVTFFTMYGQTECDDVQQAWASGHEIASHTWSHLAMPLIPPFTGGLGSIEKEIVSARDWLVANCSVPAADVVGFRSPYLVHNPAYRKVLSEHNFLYDSSINEHWPMTTSPSGGQRLWPYSMDYGIPQDCAWIAGNLCYANESYAGLYEVPVWVLQTDSYPDPAYTMDPCDGTAGVCDTFQLLKSFFNVSYNGNKAPVPIYIHSPWLADNVDEVRSFMTWVTGNYPDAYFVTMHQLIQWMKDPVPKDQMGAWLGCVPGGNAAAAVNPAPVSSPSPTSSSPSSPSSSPSSPAAPSVVPAQPKGDSTVPVPSPQPSSASSLTLAVVAVISSSVLLFIC